MSTSRKTLQFLPTVCGWVLAAGSMALAGVINLPGDSPIVQSAIDAATGGMRSSSRPPPTLPPLGRACRFESAPKARTEGWSSSGRDNHNRRF